MSPAVKKASRTCACSVVLSARHLPMPRSPLLLVEEVPGHLALQEVEKHVPHNFGDKPEEEADLAEAESSW